MPRPPAADLHRDLARAIVDHLRASGAEAGMPLSENALAQAVGTSRTPLRGALPILLELGVLERSANGRLRLRRLPGAGEEIGAADGEAGDAEEFYWRVARDRIGGALPDLVGEAELMRRYGAPRGIVHRVLLQIMGEGWIERAPAGNWRFLALIDGPDSYDESYRFRRAIEPAALLDPAFSMPPLVLARLRREQQGLLEDPASANPREVFELNSGFHLAITQASNNRFFADAGLRVTRLRRVVGYVIALDQERLATQSAEHLAILDRIEEGDREEAARLLLSHLDAGRASKAKLLENVRLQVSGLMTLPKRGTDRAA
ncbi:GntR family transcriptional regulator (plasmid) [Roseomonas gilardii subsp. gilardii]|uniref:GntR family transcriptional regulator n=1 Tax=Roseomonas gilardii TaxID=257708 RepID=UPI001FF758C2|nr:GntR family transcriptional regulator [Roseomonas gilardii]UPG74534.1 GntR family transcriptional regulator [Roseomonas gilardii subsp. gilardii]